MSALLPLVLIPGMMCDARLFSPQIKAFSGELAIHLAPISGHDTIEAMAAYILEHGPPQFALAGLSMGGIVAMEMLAQEPHRIKKLALLDTNPRAELETVKAVRDLQITKVQNGQLLDVMRDELKPRYLVDGPQKTDVLELSMSMALALGPDVFICQSRALQERPDQCSTLRKVSVPTLVLHGESDQLCTPETHQFIHGLITDSTLVTISGAGHLPTLEQPADTNAALIRWLTI